MNRNQKILTVLVIGILLLVSLKAPWQKITTVTDSFGDRSTRQMRTTVFAPIWQPPEPEKAYTTYDPVAEFRLQWGSVVLTWTALGLTYAGILFLLKGQSASTRRTASGTTASNHYALFDDLKPLHWIILIAVFVLVLGVAFVNTDFWFRTKQNAGGTGNTDTRADYAISNVPKTQVVGTYLSPQEIDAIEVHSLPKKNISTNRMTGATPFEKDGTTHN